MSGASERRAQVARVSAAVEWFTRLRDEDVSDAELAAWLQWCTDADNLKEFHKVGDLWRGVGQLEEAASGSLMTEAAPPPQVHRRMRRFALAAALLMAVGAAGLVSWRLFNGGERYAAQATILSNDLPDGSQVTLAPRSAVSTDFTRQRRVISMPQGEAFFKVHPDKSKPFVVQADEVSVTAVGTAFDVDSDPRRVMVTVQEGVVDIAGTDASKWRVSKGSQFILDRRSKSAIVQPVEADQRVAWHTGRLEYLDKPLREVVTDIGRYSAQVVEIGDSRLADIPYTGAVLTGAIDDWLAAIQTTFPIRVISTQQGHYLLVSRSSPPARTP